MVKTEEVNGMVNHVYHGNNYGYVFKSDSLYMYCLDCKKTDGSLELVLPKKITKSKGSMDNKKRKDIEDVCSKHRKVYMKQTVKLRCCNCGKELI